MDDNFWWYIARAGGLTSWALVAVAVVWGLVLSTRITNGRPRPDWVLDLHRFLGALSLVFTCVHVAVLPLNSRLRFGLPEILQPFATPHRPDVVAWGVIAAYLLVAVQVTSWLRPRIPRMVWRGVHFATFPLFVFATLHLFTAGSDAVHPVVLWTVLVLCGLIFFLLVYRIALAVGGKTAPTPGRMRVAEVIPAATGVVSLRLVATRGEALPRWQPGAHVDVILPSGTVRQYSLCGDPADHFSYRIGVLDVPDGRGGSAEVHKLRPGDIVGIRGPRNKFPLVEAPHYVFIAGGIGITPLLAMARTIAARKGSWEFVYAGRSITTMAFRDELTALDPDRVRLVPEDTDGRADLAELLATAPNGTAVYSCGPTPLLDALGELVPAEYPELTLHVERFSAATQSGSEFEVALARTGSVLRVPPDRSVLDVVRDVVPVEASCEAGVCGSCQVKVLSGVVDHRDEVLTDDERARGDLMHPCVSRAKSDRIVLDL